jgi:hypothetical protein
MAKTDHSFQGKTDRKNDHRSCGAHTSSDTIAECTVCPCSSTLRLFIAIANQFNQAGQRVLTPGARPLAGTTMEARNAERGPTMGNRKEYKELRSERKRYGEENIADQRYPVTIGFQIDRKLRDDTRSKSSGRSARGRAAKQNADANPGQTMEIYDRPRRRCEMRKDSQRKQGYGCGQPVEIDPRLRNAPVICYSKLGLKEDRAPKNSRELSENLWNLRQSISQFIPIDDNGTIEVSSRVPPSIHYRLHVVRHTARNSN